MQTSSSSFRTSPRIGMVTIFLALVFVALGFPSARAEDNGKAGLYDVVMLSFDQSKIQAIKVVRQVSWMGLAQAKALVESVPAAVREGVTKAEGEAALKALAEVNCKAELRPSKVTDARRYAIVLTDLSAAKMIQIVAMVQGATGWAEPTAAKALEKLPATVKEGMTKAEADRLKVAFENAKAGVEVREMK